MLSMVSPIRASTSTTWSGVTPNFSLTPSASYQVPSSRGIERRGCRRDQLKKVLVARHDSDVESCRRGLHRQRPDDVVGFVALGGQDSDAERLARGVHHRDLLGELVRHRRAVGLVVGREVVAKRPAGQIERRRDVLRLVLVEQLAEHRHEDVDGVGRASLGVAQDTAFGRTNRRVKRAIHLRAAVDEIDGGLQGGSSGENVGKFVLYHSTVMRNRAGIASARLALAVLRRRAVAAACGRRRRLFRQYQYEEEVYLSLDGTATVYVHASLAALNALRGTSFATAPNAPLDREAVRAFFTTPVTRVIGQVNASRRSNRRFIHVQLDVDEFGGSARRRRSRGRPTTSNATAIWYVYRQTIGPAPARMSATSDGTARRWWRSGCTCRARFDITTPAGTSAAATSSSGNRRWTKRLRGAPLVLDARMDPESILFRTLWLFGWTFVAVAITFGFVIWLIVRRAPAEKRAA